MGEPAGFALMTVMATAGLIKALGTRNSFTSGPQDCNNKFWVSSEIYGHGAIHPIPDLDACDLAVILGMNPMVSKGSVLFLPNAMQRIRGIEKRGGRVWWVDPRRSESARSCGRHLAIRPGTDAVLLVWLLHEVAGTTRWTAAVGETPALADLERSLPALPLERVAQVTGLPREDLGALLTDLLHARSPIFHMSVGVNFGPFGSLCYVLLHALMLGLGNVDRPGGWLYHPIGLWVGKWGRLLGIGTQDRPSRIGGFRPVLDSLPGAILADEILTPGADRLRSLIVIAGNPIWSIPGEARLREAFRALDQLVVIDLFRSQTAEMAHAVFPGRTWLERADFTTLGMVIQNRKWLSYSKPVLPPWGESKSEWEILHRIMAEMRLGGPMGKYFHRHLAALDHDRWLVRAQWVLSRLLDRKGEGQGRAIKVLAPSHERRPHRASRHADRTLHLFSPAIRDEANRFERWWQNVRVEASRVDAKDGWSVLSLIGRRRSLMYNSWHGADGPGGGEGPALLHPATATKLGLAAPDFLELRQDGSRSIKLPWEASRDLAEDVVSVPHGLAGLNVNGIIPSGKDAAEPFSGQHFMTGIRVCARSAPKEDNAWTRGAGHGTSETSEIGLDSGNL